MIWTNQIPPTHLMKEDRRVLPDKGMILSSSHHRRRNFPDYSGLTRVSPLPRLRPFPSGSDRPWITGSRYPVGPWIFNNMQLTIWTNQIPPTHLKRSRLRIDMN
uniref:Uncharacterized protein n=1 Tax=Cacopsylla melanoneura TaxID=428564 RepID=A0A8D8XF49_9HEMI